VSSRAKVALWAAIVAATLSVLLAVKRQREVSAKDREFKLDIAKANAETRKLMQARCLELGQVYIDRPCVPPK
jgi:hypothetical protein